MIKPYMKYGAVSAKVHSLYGQRLKDEDYSEMIRKRSVSDIAAYLKQNTSYSKALSGIDENVAHRGTLEYMIRTSVYDEYSRIMNFIGRRDWQATHFLLHKTEIDQILIYLRLLSIGKQSEFNRPFLQIMDKQTIFDWDNIHVAKDYQGVLDLIKDSSYRQILGRFLPESAKIDFDSLDIGFRSALYKQFFELAGKSYRGILKTQLDENTGSMVDLINITRIIRLKHYFSTSAEGIVPYLLPFYYKLKKPVLMEIVKAQTMEETMDLISETSYKKVFPTDDFQNLEKHHGKYIYEMNKSFLLNNPPSIMTVLSYIMLKDNEINNIVHIIEGVRYSLSQEETAAHLVGVTVKR